MSDVSTYAVELVETLRRLNMEAALKLVRRVRENSGDRDAVDMIRRAAGTDEAGLLAYTLATILLVNSEEAIWHRAARDMLSNELCHYSEAYAAAIVHARRACELDPESIENWELLIEIGSNRTQLLRGTDEIRDAAAHVRRLDPDNL